MTRFARAVATIVASVAFALTGGPLFAQRRQAEPEANPDFQTQSKTDDAFSGGETVSMPSRSGTAEPSAEVGGDDHEKLIEPRNGNGGETVSDLVEEIKTEYHSYDSEVGGVVCGQMQQSSEFAGSKLLTPHYIRLDRLFGRLLSAVSRMTPQGKAAIDLESILTPLGSRMDGCSSMGGYGTLDPFPKMVVDESDDCARCGCCEGFLLLGRKVIKLLVNIGDPAVPTLRKWLNNEGSRSDGGVRILDTLRQIDTPAAKKVIADWQRKTQREEAARRNEQKKATAKNRKAFASKFAQTFQWKICAIRDQETGDAVSQKSCSFKNPITGKCKCPKGERQQFANVQSGPSLGGGVGGLVIESNEPCEYRNYICR